MAAPLRLAVVPAGRPLRTDERAPSERTLPRLAGAALLRGLREGELTLLREGEPTLRLLDELRLGVLTLRLLDELRLGLL